MKRILFFFLVSLPHSSVGGDSLKHFKQSKITRCYVIPIVQPRLVKDDVFGDSDPMISPVSGKMIAKIIDQNSLEVIRLSVNEEKAYQFKENKKSSNYNILFVFDEGKAFLEGFITFVGDSAYINFYAEAPNDKNRFHLELSPEAIDVLSKDLINID